MLTTVVNVKLNGSNAGLQYIGRAMPIWGESPLGNPFKTRSHTESAHRYVVDQYRDWLLNQIEEGNEAVCKELQRLLDLARAGKPIKLGCWCHPLPCHGDVVKEVLDSALATGRNFMKRKVVRLGFTGHRSERVGGESPVLFERLIDLATAVIQRFQQKNPDVDVEIISGMARGWDLAVGYAAKRLGLPLIAAVPYEGQADRWNKVDKARHADLLAYAESNGRVVLVSPGPYSNAKLHDRNEWIVKNCAVLFALFDGVGTGGTYACMKYAEMIGVSVINLWDSWLKGKDSVKVLAQI